MGSTFVTLGRNADGLPISNDEHTVGFWMRDGTLELWLRLLALHLDDPTAENADVKSVRDQFLLASRGRFNGCVPHGLESATSTEAGLTLIKHAVTLLATALSEAPEKLAGGTLNLMGFYDRYGDIDAASLREVAAAFHDLLSFKITSTAGTSNAVMPGLMRSSKPA